MLLSVQDVALFFRLHRTLLFYVNQWLKVVPGGGVDPEQYATLPPSKRVIVHQALTQHLDLIPKFVEENPAGLSEKDLNIVSGWRHLVYGKFLILRELAKHTVFLSTQKPPVAYGVMALSQPFEELVGLRRPILVETTLLPFKDGIVYDGIINTFPLFFGPGMRGGFNEDYKSAKAQHGIVVSLPVSSAPPPTKRPRAKAPPKSASKDQSADRVQAITKMVERFCREKLNDEYALVCRELIDKLSRKRPSPLLSSSPQAWASGIVRTIGWVNFLNDKTQTPHMQFRDIDGYFGVSESTGAAKLAAIRKMLKVHPLEPLWTLPSRLADNPLIWMIEFNGVVLDVRNAPREVQESAFEQGLIPYIPADLEAE